MRCNVNVGLPNFARDTSLIPSLIQSRVIRCCMGLRNVLLLTRPYILLNLRANLSNFIQKLTDSLNENDLCNGSINVNVSDLYTLPLWGILQHIIYVVEVWCEFYNFYTLILSSHIGGRAWEAKLSTHSYLPKGWLRNRKKKPEGDLRIQLQ